MIQQIMQRVVHKKIKIKADYSFIFSAPYSYNSKSIVDKWYKNSNYKTGLFGLLLSPLRSNRN